MGRYLGSWKIDDIIRVHKQTSSVTTGAATDADAAPTWRVYEDDTATPVTTGSFSTLNAQTGFYVAALTLAALIGYEKGKTYAIRSQATVGGVIGADVDSFQIEAEVDANSVSVTVNANPVALAAGAITTATITDGAFSSAKFGAGFITAGSFSGNALAGMAVTVGATARAQIVDDIWDEPKVGHVTADTYGEYLDATVSAIAAGDTTVSGTAAAAIADAVWERTSGGYTTAGSMGFQVNSGIAASVTAGSIGAVTVGATAASAIASAVTAGSIGAVTVGATAAAAIASQVTANSIGAVTVGATSRAAIVDEVWDEPKAGHTTADTYGEYLDSTTGAIKTDTADIAAVKAKTDRLTFNTLNAVASNVKYVNDISVTGNGQTGTEWGPGS